MAIAGPQTEEYREIVRRANEAHRAQGGEIPIMRPAPAQRQESPREMVVVARESQAEIAARSARVREYEADVYVKAAVAEHNRRVITGPRVEKVETSPDPLPSEKEKTIDERLADAVDKLNKDREKRGYFRPDPKGK